MRMVLRLVFERGRLRELAARAAEDAVASRQAAEADGAGMDLPKSSAFHRLRRWRSHGFERVNEEG